MLARIHKPSHRGVTHKACSVLLSVPCAVHREDKQNVNLHERTTLDDGIVDTGNRMAVPVALKSLAERSRRSVPLSVVKPLGAVRCSLIGCASVRNHRVHWVPLHGPSHFLARPETHPGPTHSLGRHSLGRQSVFLTKAAPGEGSTCFPARRLRSHSASTERSPLCVRTHPRE